MSALGTYKFKTGLGVRSIEKQLQNTIHTGTLRTDEDLTLCWVKINTGFEKILAGGPSISEIPSIIRLQIGYYELVLTPTMLSHLESKCKIATDYDPFKPISGSCIYGFQEARNRKGRQFLERCQFHAPHVKQVYDSYITRRKESEAWWKFKFPLSWN
ncbi:uncharacterized protein BDZ99DRAFT_468512 [Mytilinidion resinicola]|uniref:Uncharacterized protein n=1 Tax=Mytilinidion resinicola TaxID=574789 RepID=A0A6A6Y2W9_9PEZI|nr:uncharacterized protein BDZ99DRAFT_468512 [Mytilinidion resinicola]KAF2803176.1 hypothetical protein BDZ99DRAFT_468512 [Mytilinidion resinicola]